MIPLTDNNPTRSFPIVTILLILANIACYYTQVKDGPLHDNAIIATYAMVPAKITTGNNMEGVVEHAGTPRERFVAGDPNEIGSPGDIPILPSPQPLWITIFTAMFLHASVEHIGGNMLFLWIFGNNVEDALGKLRFLVFYLGCGLVAALAQIAMGPTSGIPTLGASGAIAGVMGAYIVMWPEARVLTLFVVGLIFLREVSAFWVLGIWITFQMIQAYFGWGQIAAGGVAVFAHVGGFAAGMIAIVLMGGRALARNARSTAPRRMS